jgi:formylglycine-generating enzyme required for sulfatase activity
MDLSQWSSIQGTQVRIAIQDKAFSADFLKADFFDKKHNIVLGGSWATHPRIAGRKSLYVQVTFRLITDTADHNHSVNWYQRNYPYVWAGARLVRDV